MTKCGTALLDIVPAGAFLTAYYFGIQILQGERRSMQISRKSAPQIVQEVPRADEHPPPLLFHFTLFHEGFWHFRVCCESSIGSLRRSRDTDDLRRRRQLFNEEAGRMKALGLLFVSRSFIIRSDFGRDVW